MEQTFLSAASAATVQFVGALTSIVAFLTALSDLRNSRRKGSTSAARRKRRTKAFLDRTQNRIRLKWPFIWFLGSFGSLIIAFLVQLFLAVNENQALVGPFSVISLVITFAYGAFLGYIQRGMCEYLMYDGYEPAFVSWWMFVVIVVHIILVYAVFWTPLRDYVSELSGWILGFSQDNTVIILFASCVTLLPSTLVVTVGGSVLLTLYKHSIYASHN